MRAPRPTDESGFTLLEVLLAMVITSIVMGAIASALTVGIRTTDNTTLRLSDSHDNQLLAAHLTADLQSVAPGGIDTDPGATACSGEGTGANVITLSWTDAADEIALGALAATRVATYRRTDDGISLTLKRYFCVGSAGPQVIQMATSLSITTPPEVIINGTRVSLRLTETSGYVYTIAANARVPNETADITALSSQANQGGATAGGFIGATATLSGGTTNPPVTGTITFYLLGPSTTPPSLCPASASAVGSRVVSGNGAYTFSFIGPSEPGSYWWYADYNGNEATGNEAASGACGDVANQVVLSDVSAGNFVLSVAPVGSNRCPDSVILAGCPFTVTLRATTDGSTTDQFYNQRRVITFTGPHDAPNGQAPQYPADVCFGDISPCSGPGPGIGEASVTLFNSETVLLNATDGVRSGSVEVTVLPAVQLSISCPSELAPNQSFTSAVVRATADAWNNPDPQAQITVSIANNRNPPNTITPTILVIEAGQTSSDPGQFTYTAGSSGKGRDTITVTGPPGSGYLPASCNPRVR